MTQSTARLGPIALAPGVLPRHVLCYLWASLVSFGLFAYLTTLQPYLLAVNLHIPPEQRGVVSGNLQFWQEVAAVLLIAVVGAWSDRTGRRVIYVLGFLVMATAYALYPFAETYRQLFLYRMIFALGIATLGSLLQIVVADYPLEADRGKLTSISVFLSSAGLLLFFSVLNRLPALFREAGLSELWAGRASYLSISAIALASACIVLGLRPGRPDTGRPIEPLWSLVAQGFRAGRELRIALAYAGSFIARADIVIVSIFLALWVQSAGTASGLTPAEAARHQGMLFLAIQGSSLVWAPVFGWLADRLNRVTLVILAIVLSIAGYGAMGLVDNPLHTNAYPAAIVLGVGQISGILAVQVLVGQEAPGAIRGAVVGTVVFFGALGILFIAKLGGYAYDHWTPGAPFLIMALANVPLLIFALFVRLRAPRAAPVTA